MKSTAPAGNIVARATMLRRTGARAARRLGRLVTVTVLLTVACATPAAAASAGSWSAAGRSQSVPIANGRSSVTVMLQAPGSVLAAYDDGARRTISVAPGCVPAAISAATVALDCRQGGSASPVQLLNLVHGTVQAVPIADASAAEQLQIAAMGARWIRSVRYQTDPNNPGVRLSTVLVDRNTGELRSLASSQARSRLKTDSGHYVDLDASNPIRRVCSPLRRLDGPGYLVSSNDAFGPLVELDNWTVAQGLRPGSTDSVVYRLQRCGTNHVTVQSRSPVELSRTRAAYRVGDEIRLRDLVGKRTLHRYRIPPAAVSSHISLALSTGRMWLSSGSGSQQTLFSVRLHRVR